LRACFVYFCLAAMIIAPSFFAFPRWPVCITLYVVSDNGRVRPSN
jgi:hypothetical protein